MKNTIMPAVSDLIFSTCKDQSSHYTLKGKIVSDKAATGKMRHGRRQRMGSTLRNQIAIKKRGENRARPFFFYRVGTQKYLHQLSEARGKSVGGSHP